MLIFYFIIFIFGLTVGSFLNVVIYRLENGEKIINDRSRCLRCKHILAWYDLFPVLSFVFLKGKCRYCGKKISWQYPLVEMGTGVLFILVVNHILRINELTSYELISNFQFPILSLLFWFYIIATLIVIFVYDLKHYIIPDKVIYPAIIVSGVWYLISGNYTKYDIPNTIYQVPDIIFAAFIAGGFFLSIVIITKGKGMGGGDIKLAFLMGLILGCPTIVFSVFLAFISGSIIGICLIMAGKKKMKSMIPFGPFLIFGTFVGLFWGREIVEWYLNRII